VISPFARAHFVDHTLTDQSSVARFVEENWGTSQIGGGSYDQLTGPLWNMFDFDDYYFNNLTFGQHQLILDPTTGQPSGQYR
jgi:phospholipase C